jgi:hypothetical protein
MQIGSRSGRSPGFVRAWRGSAGNIRQAFDWQGRGQSAAIANPREILNLRTISALFRGLTIPLTAVNLYLAGADTR